MARVKIEDLTKKFGDTVAVNKLNLEVEDKSLVCLLGPSGCGKTTTLRMIAGLETPTNGGIYIGDELVNDLSPAERDIAMVFQFYALYPTMTVAENLAFPLKAQKLTKREINDRVREVADVLHIAKILSRKPSQLTAGEAQRVAIGRAIVRRPRVYLLDEPLTNLDAKLRAFMRAELKKLQKDLGQTTIYVTHDQLEAITMADKIAVMDRGVLQQYDVPENIYDRPKNLFVAGFIGSPPMNFIDCTMVESDGKFLADSGEFRLDLSEMSDVLKRQLSTNEVILGVRPEHIVAQTRRLGPDSIDAEVYVAEPMGDQSILSLKIGRHLIKTVVPISMEADVGSRVWIDFNRDKLHIIDSRTETTIV